MQTNSDSQITIYKQRQRNPKGYGWIESTGYRRIQVNYRKTSVHRVIIEQQIGRRLDRTEQVHHKNGDKLDNRLENLLLISQSDHLKMHKTKYPIIDGIKKKCGNCFEILPLSSFNKRKSDLGLTTICKECNKIKCREYKLRKKNK